jgi:hypothetical protein
MGTTIAELNEIVAKIGITMNGLAEDQRKTELVLQDLARSGEETRRTLQETLRVQQETMENLSGNIGGINRRIGKIVELVILPGLMKKINVIPPQSGNIGKW